MGHRRMEEKQEAASTKLGRKRSISVRDMGWVPSALSNFEKGGSIQVGYRGEKKPRFYSIPASDRVSSITSRVRKRALV